MLEVPTIAGLVPITDIMSRDVTCARRDLEIEVVIDLVIRNYIGCLPVVDEAGAPIGMITKRDLVEHLAAALATRVLQARTADDAMLPLAFTIGEHATVAQAAKLMAAEDVHHVPVVSDTGRLVGVVSTLDVVRWLARNDGFIDRTTA